MDGLVSFPSVMDIYDVKEMFSRYYVDPDIVRQKVPPKWKVKIHDNGKALLLVMVQKCKKMVLDYIINVGSVGMSHIWIELDGPHEVVTPLPGTMRSLPTWYWYILPHQLDDQWVRALFGLVGIAAQSVRKVSLGGDPGGTRSGEVMRSIVGQRRASSILRQTSLPEVIGFTGSMGSVNRRHMPSVSPTSWEMAKSALVLHRIQRSAS